MKQMKKLWLICLSFCAFGISAASYEKVVTTGQGETLDQAIDVGLRRAVEQVSGVSVDSARISSLSSKNDGQTNTLMQQTENASAMRSRGDVKYKVISERCADGTCHVRLEVQVEVDPHTKMKDLNSNRRTIAMGEFLGPKSSIISKKIQELLVHDRKFKVLNEASDPNLQYLVTGRVIEAQTKKRVVDNSKTIELTGEEIKDVKVYYHSRVLVEFKILDLANNQVKWSATIPTTSSRNNLSLLLDIASRKVFTQLKDNIYPMLVLVGDTGTLVLNSGGTTVKKGQYLDVFKLGERFVDPVTKESLGRDEIKVATVRVTKVLSKMAYLSVVKGDAAMITNHSIARQSTYAPVAASSKSHSSSRKASVKTEEKSVGIIL